MYFQIPIRQAVRRPSE